MPSKSLNLPSSKLGSSFFSVERKKRLRRYTRSLKVFYRKWHLNHLAPIPYMLVYMIVGGFLFWWSENSAEFERLIERREFLTGIRAEFVKGVELAMEDEDLTRRQRRKLIALLVDGLFDQLDITLPPADNTQVEAEQEWTFTTAMYFSGTLFTTIGYGDIACETAVGQIVTIIYSIIGIPMMLITLNELGKFLYKSINEFMAFLNSKWQQYFVRYLCCSYFKPKQKKLPSRSVRRTFSSPTDRMAQNEAVRKATHFFKDQRIAQREIVFDFDLKSVADEFSTLQEVETGGLSASESRKQRSSERSETMEEEVPRMHVLVAITFTVSWVLFCAALFKHVEDWSYNKSLYFVCISLLTVGLGDVKVARRGYMLLFFAFVMIGLSLVSMCINVIQNSIEDFYRRLLAQMLENYKNGEADNLKNNWLAKFLLPLLGKRRRASMMRKIREEAEKCGVEIPDDMEKIFEKPKEESEKDTTKSDFSEIEVEIQPPSESTHSDEEEQVIDADMLLGIPDGWSRERRPSFQLDDDQMQLIPYADSSVLLAEEDSARQKAELEEDQTRRQKISVPQLKIVPYAMIVTEKGEQQHVHSIECPTSLLP